MKKAMLSIVLMLAYNLFVVSQNNTVNQFLQLPKLVPLSPESASLLKYQETNVSHYTGVPNISIPICNIKSRSLNHPITLNYHASGVKVNEMASWVGLGWSLNTGGQITRIMRGLPDDNPNGYIHTDKTVSFIKNLPTEAERDPYMIDAQLNQLDTQPDEFKFNFMGYSGTYIFNQNRSTVKPKGQIIQIPKNNLRIKPILSGNTIISWEITTPDGTQYTFGKTENSREKSNEGSSVWFFHDGTTGVIGDNINPLGNYISSWKLTEIKTYKNDIITFEYDKTLTFDSTISLQRSMITGSGIENKARTKFTFISFDNSYLKKITTVNGSIEFELKNREDISGIGKALDRIVIKNNFGSPIKKIDFITDYFISDPIPENSFYYDFGQNHKETWRKRLKLNKIEFRGANNIKDHQYTFNYNSTTNLPHRNSFAQDYWGYYNGQINNVHLLPEGSYKTVANTPTNFNGANRSIYPQYVSANMLTSIIFPEGGRTDFEYENNYYKTINNNVSSQNTITQYETITDVFSSNNSNFSESFNGFIKRKYFSKFITIENISQNIFNIQTYSNSCSQNANTINCNRQLRLLKYTSKFDNNPIEIWSGIPQNNRVNNIVTALNGLYRFEYTITKDNHIPLDFFEVNYSYKKEIITNEDGTSNSTSGTVGPGMRIKKITSYNELGKPIKTKEYEYKQKLLNTQGSSEYSSGILNSKPTFAYYYGAFGTLTSSSIAPLLNTKGHSVNYKHVQELITDIKTNLKKHNKFEFSHIPFDSKYPTIPTESSWMDGNLKWSNNNGFIKHRTYDTAYQNFPVENNSFEHSEAITPTIYVVNSSDYPILFETLYRKIYTGTSLVKQETFIEKYHPSGDSLKTKTEYFYQLDNILPKETRTVNSKSEVLKSIYIYPTNGVLFNQNRISSPTDTKFFKNGEQLSHQRTTYLSTHNPSNLFLPSNIQFLKGIPSVSNVLEDRVIYHNYDNKGNPTEVSKKDGTHIVYIWGYNQTQPVAKIENATLSQVSTYISNIQNKSNADNDREIDETDNQGNITKYTGNEGQLRLALNALRNIPSLSNSLITTYTYDPLIGVTSITDPRGQTIYYDYDNFNRLKYVKDKDGNILKENKYNYKN